ncbi:hypothetical protein PHIN3_2 [Sinorhizobium phage phiN3]|uniref:Uncharacterized protein n=1 Tax=Sinorhizobium phage phiN3 TaxID=1647405 RepID=A0A0F6YPW4_9CAUD|nr:hypothetical protein AVT40_gp002 [Sinorhizobium phage phiN3]AKF13269.1 hypothetical protein PHIN3_2 [Sinorhizobium phage phiN3]
MEIMPIFTLRMYHPETSTPVSDNQFQQMSFYIERDRNPVLYPTIADALRAMEGLEEVDVTVFYELLRASSSIANESRRGLGNVIYTNDAHVVYSQLPEYVTIVFDEDFPGTFLVYEGSSKHMDGAILHTEQGYALHPDYKLQARKINLL